MVNHFKITFELRIFIFNRVIAMRAAGDYFLDVVALQYFNILLGLRLIGHLIA